MTMYESCEAGICFVCNTPLIPEEVPADCPEYHTECSNGHVFRYYDEGWSQLRPEQIARMRGRNG